MEFPLVELGGSGQTLNVAVANGFPPETYLPMLGPLMPDFRVVSLLPRALWPGAVVPTSPGTWQTDLARDLTVGLDQHGLNNVIGLGHSFGGIATILAALEDVTRFRALVLLDPTILTRQMLAGFDAMRLAGTMLESFPLAGRTLKRQRSFADRNSAYDYFRPRGIFKDWDDAALHAYVEFGLIPSGEGLTLRWTPEWEAYYFMTGFTRTWDILPKLDGLLPTLIVRGAESDTYTADSAGEVRDLLPSATHIDIPGHGHLFPHSAPALTGQIVLEWLAEHGIT